jgi:predicted nucleotidyltransferase
MMEKYNINQTTLRILGLYKDDYKRSLHLREISRRIGVDVKSIQLQVKRLEKTNVLTSLLKGRNKEYQLNLGNLSVKYYMVMAEAFASINFLQRNFLIKKIVDEIGHSIDGVVLLFGSYAKGAAVRGSDVDLFVIAERKPNWRVFQEVGDLIDREVTMKSADKRQFIDGLKNNDPLVREVVSDHLTLKGIDDFCEIMWRYYAGQ